MTDSVLLNNGNILNWQGLLESLPFLSDIRQCINREIVVKALEGYFEADDNVL